MSKRPKIGIETLQDFFDLWSMRIEAAKCLGISPQHISLMIKRKSIPPKHWARFIAEAQKINPKFTLSHMLWLNTGDWVD